jgi:diguanylate cyclase (GGDEF)-like protein/PAS domain S-box-containing protein
MKRSSAGLSIFSRLLIALLSVVMLISGVLTTAFYVYSHRAVDKQTTENILQQFQTISYHFRYELRDALVKDLQLLASNPALDGFITGKGGREIEVSEVERFFLQSLKYSRSYESITFIDRAGSEVVKVNWSGRVRAYRDAAERPLFRALKNGLPGGIDVEGPVIAPYGEVLFSAGIQKTGARLGDFSGAVIIDHSLKDFIDYLDKIRIFDVNPLWLFLPDGTVVKQPNDKRAFLDPRPHLTAGFHKEPVLAPLENGMLVYQDLYINPDHPLLRLAISIPSSVLLEDTGKVLRFFLIVSAVSLLFISLLAYYLAGYLSRPIIGLAQAASRLAKGDLSARVPGTSTGEVRLLIDSFNRMGEDLQKTTVSKEYMDNIIGSMMDTLIVVSPEGVIERLNQAACLLLGHGEGELIGRHVSAVVADGLHGDAGLADILSRGSISTVEKSYITKNGTNVPVLFSAAVMRSAEGAVRGIVCVAKDITDRKQMEERLQRLALYDTLTGLPNRALFFDRANHLLAVARRNRHMLAFLYMDLDRFKTVNDGLGHEVGDLLLAEAGRRIASCTRKEDTVARMGGDEFIGLCGKIASPEDAAVVARKIIGALTAPFLLRGRECDISVSIGISLYPYDGEDAQTLVSRADAAMYRIKEQGRGGFAYHSAVSIPE